MRRDAKSVTGAGSPELRESPTSPARGASDDASNGVLADAHEQPVAAALERARRRLAVLAALALLLHLVGVLRPLAQLLQISGGPWSSGGMALEQAIHAVLWAGITLGVAMAVTPIARCARLEHRAIRLVAAAAWLAVPIAAASAAAWIQWWLAAWRGVPGGPSRWAEWLSIAGALRLPIAFVFALAACRATILLERQGRLRRISVPLVRLATALAVVGTLGWPIQLVLLRAGPSPTMLGQIMLAFGLLTFVLRAALELLVLVLLMRVRPAVTELCPRCFYDLRANPHACPECGWERRLPSWSSAAVGAGTP